MLHIYLIISVDIYVYWLHKYDLVYIIRYIILSRRTAAKSKYTYYLQMIEI